MTKHLSKIVLFLLMLLFSGLPTPSQAQRVGEIDLNCEPTFTPRSQHPLPNRDEYYPSYGADVSPDGKLLTLAAVNRIVFFDTQTFEPIQQITLNPQHQDHWRVVAWSSDGDYLAVYIGPRNGILIINAATDEVEHLLPTNDEFTSTNAYTLSWSPDGSKLAVLGQLPWRVWDVESGEILYEVISEHIYALTPIVYGEQYLAAWSPDNSQLAIPHESGVVLLDTTTWSAIATLPVSIDRVVSLKWSNNERLFVTDTLQVLEVWNPVSQERIAQLSLRSNNVARLSLDETLLAVAGGKDISILDPETLEIITTITSETMLGSIINLHWLDDERVIVYGEYSLVEVWNIKTGEMEHTWHVNCIAQE